MPQLRHALPVLGLALAVGACAAPATPPPDPAVALAAIGTLRTDYAAAFNAGDVNKLMTLYASDAVMMQENQPAVTGHDAIMAALQATMTQFTPSMTLNAEETKVMGDWAFDRGQFTMNLTPKAPGTAGMMEHGKYLVLLQKQADGSWKVAREIGNANMMMPMPEAPAPAKAKVGK